MKGFVLNTNPVVKSGAIAVDARGDGGVMIMEENNRKQTEENTALQMMKKPVHWGIADSSENIDRYLYGENQ